MKYELVLNGVAQVSSDEQFTYKDGRWFNSDLIIQDMKKLYQQVDTLIGPIEFKLRFNAAERVLIDGLLATDTSIKNYFQLLDDSRNQEVDLRNSDVQAGVLYALDQVAGALSYTPEAKEARRKAILSL